MKKGYKLPPYRLISSAVDGNEQSIERILAFYDPYISKCCLRPLYDEYGNVYIVVDMELKGRIREAIIKMILDFMIYVIHAPLIWLWTVQQWAKLRLC